MITWTEEEMAVLRGLLAGGTPIEQLFWQPDSAKRAKMLVAAERARFREKVEAMRAHAERRAADMGNHPRDTFREEAFAEVLVLLAKPEEERT